MRTTIKALGGFTLLAFQAACSDSGDSDELPMSTLNDGPGEFTTDFADSDEFFTQMSEPARGLAASPHGVVQIYYSNNMEPAIGEDTFIVPPGTVAIKTQKYDSAGDYGEILVMIKQEAGSLPESDDWLYEVRDKNGDVQASGDSSVKFCNDCHRGYKEMGSLPGFVVMN